MPQAARVSKPAVSSSGKRDLSGCHRAIFTLRLKREAVSEMAWRSEVLWGCDVETSVPTLIIKELEPVDREIIMIDAAESLEDEAGRVGKPGRSGHVFPDACEATKVGAIDIDEPKVGRKAVG